MDVPDEVRRDAERTGALVGKKLMEIMELQADIDTLLRGDQPTPFGSEKWQYACLEALQRVVAMTASSSSCSSQWGGSKATRSLGSPLIR